MEGQAQGLCALSPLWAKLCVLVSLRPKQHRNEPSCPLRDVGAQPVPPPWLPWVEGGPAGP